MEVAFALGLTGWNQSSGQTGLLLEHLGMISDCWKTLVPCGYRTVFFFFSPPVFLLAVSWRLLSAPRYYLHSLPFGFLHLQNEKQRISVASNPHPYPIFEALSPGGDKFLLQPQLIRSGLLKAHWKYLPVLRSADLALLSYLYILLHSSTRLVSDWVTGRKGWENFAYKRGGNILGAIPNSTYYSSRVHHD